MNKRETAISKEISIETTECCNCHDEVLTNSDQSMETDYPMGVCIIIGGGDHMTTESTGWEARSKKWRNPRRIIKWFDSSSSRLELQKKYLCPSCASSIYNIDTGSLSNNA